MVPSIVDIGLNRNILARDKDSTLLMNFDPELLAVLREVNCLKQMSRSGIPEEAIKVSDHRILYRASSSQGTRAFGDPPP